MPEFIHTESEFSRSEEKDSLVKLSLANISNIKQNMDTPTGFFTRFYLFFILNSKFYLKLIFFLIFIVIWELIKWKKI